MQSDSPKVIAVFDFDGTITNKDTLFDFICYYFGMPRLVLGLFVLSPVLILFKLGFISNERAKGRLFSCFFKGKSETEFSNACESYKERINQIVRPEAINKIKYHQQEGHMVVIVSASVSNWIIPWAQSVCIGEVVGTQIEVKDDYITGKFQSRNCYGQEKVERFLKLFPYRQAYQLYVYGDSNGDKQLLDIADFHFYKCF